MVSIHHCSANPREEMPDDHSYIDDIEQAEDTSRRERFAFRFHSKNNKATEVTTPE